MKETFKGYKAFSPGFYCEVDGNRKQYAENTVFEELGAESCCRSGVMHFCKTPFDCLDYYPLVNKDGKFSEFAEVEALDEVHTEDNKCATKKLKIGAKLDFKGFVKAGIDVLIESTKPVAVNSAVKNDNGGDWAKIGSSGNEAQIGSSGDWAKIGSSGNGAQIGSSGNGAQIGSSGNWAKVEATGVDSVVSAIGVNSTAKAAFGCWIVLAEYGKWNGSYYPVKCVRAAQVDGTAIKPDTWYKLENGEFVEVEDADSGSV